MPNLDETYCASPNCQNLCGRKMDYHYKEYLYRLEQSGKTLNIKWAYFCGEPRNFIIDGAAHKSDVQYGQIQQDKL